MPETMESTRGLGAPVFVATPEEPGPQPSVVVLHERYGLVEHPRNMARRLAAAGYVAAAPNLFFEHPDQRGLADGTATARLTDPHALEILDDVLELLRTTPAADADRLAVLGACATGRHPVLWGANRHLDACVVFHGLYRNREWEPDGEYHTEHLHDLVGRLQAPFLGLFGELDHLVSVDDVRFIRGHFEDQDKSYRIVCYAGAPHGWTDSTMSGRYRPEIAEAAWGELLTFLERHLVSPRLEPATVDWSYTSSKSRLYDFTANVRRD
ncbi:MAG TPA: dienelactone hydrolase family protein [Acidimicrobiales bacterium]|nr:dienelactone hydrolase family protein [Acidimicrobiales bacterium]